MKDKKNKKRSHSRVAPYYKRNWHYKNRTNKSSSNASISIDDYDNYDVNNNNDNNRMKLQQQNTNVIKEEKNNNANKKNNK